MSENEIFIEKYNKVVAEDFKQVFDADWHGITLHIKRCLSIEEMMSFVSDVTSSCFTTATNEYIPEIKDFTTRCCILELYAGIVLPKSIHEKYNMAYNSDIVSFIVKYVDPSQFNAMLAAIDRKLEHLAQSNIEALNMRVEEVISGLSEIEENLSGIFGGVDGDTITKIAETIADGGFDVDKLVKAFAGGTNADDKIVQIPKADE